MRYFRGVLVLMTLAVSGPAFASEKKGGACRDGWEVAKGAKDICYRIASTETDSDTTLVQGEVTSPRDYRSVQIALSLYKGGKLACTTDTSVSNLTKGDDIAFRTYCSYKVIEKPDKIVIRVVETSM